MCLCGAADGVVDGHRVDGSLRLVPATREAAWTGLRAVHGGGAAERRPFSAAPLPASPCAAVRGSAPVHRTAWLPRQRAA